MQENNARPIYTYEHVGGPSRDLSRSSTHNKNHPEIFPLGRESDENRRVSHLSGGESIFRGVVIQTRSHLINKANLADPKIDRLSYLF